METTTLEQWLDVTVGSLQNLWSTVLNFLPALLGAIVILLIGLIVAAILERIVERIFFYLKIDDLFRKAEIDRYFERANIKLNVGHFMGKLVYWFVVIGFLLAASDILNFTAFSSFLQSVLNFIPNVAIATLIMLATLVAGHFLRSLVSTSVSGAGLHYSRALGMIAWWAVFLFGFIAALSELGINVAILNNLILGLIAMMALAGGLAFGLGGKDFASKFLANLGEHMRK